MKKSYLTGLLIALSLASCQQDELTKFNENQSFSENIKVVDGYLSFSTNDAFKEYLISLKSSGSQLSTRSLQQTIPGFTSISSLKKTELLTTKSDDENMSQSEYNVMKAEELLADPVLTEVMDTTLRIRVEDRIFKITKDGTFSTSSKNEGFLKEAIEKFDSKLVGSNENGKYIELGNGVTFTNSFGEGSSVESNLEPINNEVATRAETPDLHNGYNVDSYQWQNNSWWQGLWDKMRGKDVTRENYFSSDRRVQVNVFDINYAFYASAGISVKMQKRKRFLFVKYWVSEDADKLAVGFNNVEGVLTLKNPCSFSSIAPTASSKWGSFTSTINGIASKFIYANYREVKIVKDWVDALYCISPEIKLNGNVYPNKDLMNQLYNTPPNIITSFLKQVVNENIYGPIQTKIQPKDPRVAYFVWGNNPIQFDKEKSYIMGVKEYSGMSSKTVRFDQSFGITVNNFSVSGFLPSKFDINKIDAFGAAYYNGVWKGVRFVN